MRAHSFRTFSFALALLLTGLGLQAQLDSGLAYCNLFYATSDHPEIIPFEDLCFVNLNYEIEQYPMVRVVGPVKAQNDFFRNYDWSIEVFLPPMDAKGLLAIEVPKDMISEDIVMPPGKMFLTICDNRTRRYYGPDSHKVDFVAVEGKIKINEYTPIQPGWKHPEVQAQMDVYVQQVVQSEQGPKLTGPKIRFKSVLVVENKKEE